MAEKERYSNVDNITSTKKVTFSINNGMSVIINGKICHIDDLKPVYHSWVPAWELEDVEVFQYWHARSSGNWKGLLRYNPFTTSISSTKSLLAPNLIEQRRPTMDEDYVVGSVAYRWTEVNGVYTVKYIKYDQFNKPIIINNSDYKSDYISIVNLKTNHVENHQYEYSDYLATIKKQLRSEAKVLFNKKINGELSIYQIQKEQGDEFIPNIKYNFEDHRIRIRETANHLYFMHGDIAIDIDTDLWELIGRHYPVSQLSEDIHGIAFQEKDKLEFLYYSISMNENFHSSIRMNIEDIKKAILKKIICYNMNKFEYKEPLILLYLQHESVSISKDEVHDLTGACYPGIERFANGFNIGDSISNEQIKSILKRAPEGSTYIVRSIVKKYKEQLLTFAIRQGYAEIVGVVGANEEYQRVVDLTDDDL